MASGLIFGGLAALSASIFGFCFVPKIVLYFSGTTPSTQLKGGKAGASAKMLRSGISIFKPLAALVLKQRKVKAVFEEACEYCYSRSKPTKAAALCSIWLAFIALSLVLSLLVFGSVVSGVLVVLCFSASSVAFLQHRKTSILQSTKQSVPDLLRNISTCFSSGFTLAQTFAHIAKDSSGPLSDSFSSASKHLAAGGSYSEALDIIKQNPYCKDLEYIFIALEIQQKSGGSIQVVLETAIDCAESVLDLQRSLKVQTAQAQLSAKVVSLMPFVLLAFFSFLSKDFLTPFFTSIEGLMLLAVAIIMQASGIMIVRAMLKVQVE